MTTYDQFRSNVELWSSDVISLLTNYSFSSSFAFSLYVNNKFELKVSSEPKVFNIANYATTGISTIYSNRNKTYEAEELKVMDTISSARNNIFVVDLNFAAFMTSAVVNGSMYRACILNPKMIERIHRIYADIGFMHFSPKINKKGTIFARDFNYNNEDYRSSARSKIARELLPTNLSAKKRAAYLDEQLTFEAEMGKLYQPTLRDLNTKAVQATKDLVVVQDELKAVLERNKEKSSEQSTTPVILTWT